MKQRRLAALGLALSVGLGGLGPTALAAGRPQVPLITLDMLSAEQGWAMNTAGQILKTTNGGQGWTNAGSRILAQAIQHIAKAGNFYLGGPTPGGNLVASQGRGTIGAFPNPWTAWVTLPVAHDAIQIWHTGDGGQRWTSSIISRVGAGPGGLALSEITAIGNHDAWLATNRLWHTNMHHSSWYRMAHGGFSGIEGMVFANGLVGVLAGGSNIVYGPHSAALTVTTNGGSVWRSPQHPLPLLPGNWATTVLDPVVVPHTQQFIVAVLMQKPFPSKATPLTTWWRLEESTNDGATWRMLPKTPNPVLTAPSKLIMQAWVTSDIGWVVVGDRLFQTTDAGRHWAPNPLPPGIVINVSRISVTQGFVLMQQGHHTTLYRTQDRGRLWSRVSASSDA